MIITRRDVGMSKINFFDKIAQYLLTALKISGDKRIAPYCAEYLVAKNLSLNGHDVEVLQKKRGPDIHLKDIGKYIEVKSGHSDLLYWDCGASFYNGDSIKKHKFDYCIFVVFNNLEPREFLIFSVEELREVAEKPRPYPTTAFPNNRCVLFWYGNPKKYKENVKGDNLEIEVQLHQHPEQFIDRWDKIK
ncbi:MAG: hypothetical protein OEZ40_06300 [Candidatus Bathyarchaeota archaeon]|nr:hypothetical protein [Candidatus Bathyarchaeota archaeon]